MPGRTKGPKPRPTDQALADIYAEKYTTFDALRAAMVQNGIVEHGIPPYDVIQRAIDDTETDYLLTRQKIDHDTNGNPQKIVNHPLYSHMEDMREAAVRYSTFALQYNIAKRQLQISETRTALLANTLRTVLTDIGVPQDKIREVPKLLIEALSNAQANRLDEHKAEALTEILHNDSSVEIIDVEAKPPRRTVKRHRGNGNGSHP